MIIYNVDDIKMPVFPKRKISLWIKQVAEDRGKRVGEVAYIFCSDRKILELNRTYLNHDYYTDIITFDYSENDIISGDIFISVDTVRTNAEQLSVGYCNELYRVIIHGILHLCGIEDKTPEARIIMENNEDNALGILYDRWIKSDSPPFDKM
ncbi:MAG: rRNA maturation RNase YbeY [Tannerella sp.]|jgi:rRNA maturation RNase YbeY|nr:rRNA maturation RNase YbeY [Tannerella sp.]